MLTIRIDSDLTRSLAREARRRRKTKSEVAREILAAGLGLKEENSIAQEARRQSLLVSRRRSEKETLELIEQTADTRGWASVPVAPGLSGTKSARGDHIHINVIDRHR